MYHRGMLRGDPVDALPLDRIPHCLSVNPFPFAATTLIHIEREKERYTAVSAARADYINAESNILHH